MGSNPSENNNVDKEHQHYYLRATNQRITRRDYLNSLPEKVRSVISSYEYFLSPYRETVIMDLLHKYSTRNILVKEYNTEEEVYRFVSSFKRIPNHLDVYVWSSLNYGPVYKMDLKWTLENFKQLWNSQVQFDFVLISDNGKIGMMVSPYYELGETIFIVKKWGLM